MAPRVRRRRARDSRSGSLVVQGCIRDALDTAATWSDPGDQRVRGRRPRPARRARRPPTRGRRRTAAWSSSTPSSPRPRPRHAPPGVEVVCGDASTTSAYAGAVPADLVLVCGIFGNISDDDIHNTVDALPSCARRARPSSGRATAAPPDLTVDIRQWFAEAGFEEVAFTGSDDFLFGVGAHRLTAPTARVRARRAAVHVRRLRRADADGYAGYDRRRRPVTGTTEEHGSRTATQPASRHGADRPRRSGPAGHPGSDAGRSAAQAATTTTRTEADDEPDGGRRALRLQDHATGSAWWAVHARYRLGVVAVARDELARGCRARTRRPS